MNTSLTGRAEGVGSSGLPTGWTIHLLKTSLPVTSPLACGGLGRVAACMTSLHHSWLALEPSMALGSFSLSLLIQVHEAAAVVASGGDAGDDGGDGGVTQRTTTTRTR